MKSNVPEKIYVADTTFPDYVDFDGSPINTKRIDKHDIEYIRTDAFIEKIQKKLDNLYHKWFDDSTGMEVSEEGAEIGALDMAYETFQEIINSLKNKK